MIDNKEKSKNFLPNYDYSLPPQLIAQKPVSPRDSGRMLVYSRKSGEIKFDRFINLPKYLPSRAVLVFNQTKVIPARLVVQKETGGKAEILYVKTKGNTVYALSNKFLLPGTKLFFKRKLLFIVKQKKGKEYLLKPAFPVQKLSSVLLRHGKTPIPPYIKNTPLSEKALRKEYQSVFAKHNGSIAAPTASLHFTKRLLQKLKREGFDIAFVTLHVNLGTFAPLTENQLTEGKLHEEFYEIDSKTARFLNQAKKEGRSIIVVGTTVVRTLESASGAKSALRKLSSSTDLFIQEGYQFRFVDGIITNFHVPRSSLMMLISAFVGRKTLLTMYQNAIKKKLKFFSFGDGMLIV